MATKPKKAANLAREIWRLKGYCEKCGKTNNQVQLQGAHLIGVGTAIRICADLRNGFSLCAYCHRYFEDHPHEFVEWTDKTWAREYIDTLRRLAVPGQGPKINWDDKIAFLKDVKKRIQAGKLTIEQARSLEADNLI